MEQISTPLCQSMGQIHLGYIPMDKPIASFSLMVGLIDKTVSCGGPFTTVLIR